ncbi:alpha/beta fold hydrolase [Streptomyces sp. NPDC002668]|uniref:thioesterase II family protein n=1 Tax=Streptomyces sp. NPDC002668 TaxID=3154422 RepID=UPI0033175B6A
MHCPKPVTDPEVRVLLMHHAGGSHREYRQWVQYFPHDWEVWLVSRRSGAPMDQNETVSRFCHRIADVLVPLSDRPLALFGHSMGALICYELAHVMRQRGLPDPVWLGVSAHGGPRQCTSRCGRARPTSTDLRTMVGELGGLQAGILGNDALWAIIEPTLRSDIDMIASWIPEKSRLRLRTPITAFCGESDAMAGPEAVRAWDAYTEEFMGVRTHVGGHFYFRNSVEALVGQIVSDVQLRCSRVGDAPASVGAD